MIAAKSRSCVSILTPLASSLVAGNCREKKDEKQQGVRSKQ